MEPIEQLAEALRRRLIARARDGDGAEGVSLVEDVRELVDAEVPALPDDERAALCARVVRLATGLGPLEPPSERPRGRYIERPIRLGSGSEV